VSGGPIEEQGERLAARRAREVVRPPRLLRVQHGAGSLPPAAERQEPLGRRLLFLAEMGAGLRDADMGVCGRQELPDGGAVARDKLVFWAGSRLYVFARQMYRARGG